VRYVGYSDDYDECREINEILIIDEEGTENLVPFLQLPTIAVKFCLFGELVSRIKSPAERLTPFV